MSDTNKEEDGQDGQEKKELNVEENKVDKVRVHVHRPTRSELTFFNGRNCKKSFDFAWTRYASRAQTVPLRIFCLSKHSRARLLSFRNSRRLPGTNCCVLHCWKSSKTMKQYSSKATTETSTTSSSQVRLHEARAFFHSLRC